MLSQGGSKAAGVACGNSRLLCMADGQVSVSKVGNAA